MNESNENFYLTNAPIKKLLIKFSIPCVLAMLVSALYNIVDQIFIGNSTAGTAGIMATTLVFPFTVVALAISQLIGDGCATLFSISLGAKDEKTGNKSVGNAIITVVLLSIALVILGFIFMQPILSILGVNGYDERCILFTKQYYKIILCGTPFYMFASSMASIIRASSAPGYSMISIVVGAIINLIFDPILIFTFNLGIQGAAIATISGQIVSALLCAIYFRKPKLMKLTKECFKIDAQVLGKLLKLGISSFITQVSIAIITIVANNVVGAIGGENATDAGGALGIVFKIFAIVLAFSLGVAVGGQPIIGFNYGAKKYKRVLETYKLIISDNVATNMLIDFFGIDKINKTIENIGCRDIKLYSEFKSVEDEVFSETTAYDYYLVWKKLNDYEIFDKDTTQEIIDIIKNQKYHEMVGDGIDKVYKEVENPIVNYIVTKSGKYQSVRNDGGIVSTKYGNYILTIFIKDFKDKDYRNDEYVYSQGKKISNIIFNEFIRNGTI